MQTSKPMCHPHASSDAPSCDRTAADDREAASLDQTAALDTPSLLWARYAAHVRHVLRRMLRPDPDLEDLTQEVFLRAFQRVETLREATSVGGFLRGIAVHVALDERRRRRRRVSLWLDDDGVVEGASVSQADFQSRCSLRRLIEVLDGLTPKMRAAFVLREIEDRELADVAQTLACSIATAKRLIVKARAIVTAAARRDPALSTFVIDEPDRSPIDHTP